jgi:two-component system, NarL family, invasion response regulator UvrY
MIRLVVADDHPVVREGLKHVIACHRDIQVVGEAEDADGVLHACASGDVDVLLLDVSMPGAGVIETIHRLKAVRRPPRVLVLSVHSERHYAKRVIKAGADGYLTKTHSPSALADAIPQVHAGRKYATSSLAEELALDLSRGGGLPAHESLSNREFEVLVRLGAGGPTSEIAQQLGVSTKTVRTYRARILEKMGLKSTAEIILYAVQHELVPRVEG